MAIQLEKKKPIDLTKKNPGLTRLFAGLSWDSTVVNGHPVDCDTSAFMLGANNKVPTERCFVFYNNLESDDGSTRHQGDNRDGAGDGDDEVIEVDLARVRREVMQILFTVTIHESEERGHNFGNVRNAAIRLVNAANGNELCSFQLTEQFADADSLVIGRLFRDGSEWKFEAMGDAFGGGLAALVGLYT